jgi:hypothetical protein
LFKIRSRRGYRNCRGDAGVAEHDIEIEVDAAKAAESLQISDISGGSADSVDSVDMDDSDAQYTVVSDREVVVEHTADTVPWKLKSATIPMTISISEVSMTI